MAGRPSSSRRKSKPQASKASKTNTRNAAKYNTTTNDVENTVPDIPTSEPAIDINGARTHIQNEQPIDNTDSKQDEDISLKIGDNTYRSEEHPINLESLQAGKGWLSSFQRKQNLHYPFPIATIISVLSKKSPCSFDFFKNSSTACYY